MTGSTANGRKPRGGRAISSAGICSIVCMAVVALVAACGSSGTGQAGRGPAAPARSASPAASAAAVVPALAAGRQGSRQQVPWAQVGPGWILAEWSPTSSGSAETSLFLIDPAGGRYLIDTFPANPDELAPTILVGWSGDGQRALLTSSGASPTVAVVTLRTLATTQFELANAFPVGFTKPDGAAIIVNVSTDGLGHTKLERVSLAGQVELSYPTSFPEGTSYNGSALYSPDGTELAVGTCHVLFALCGEAMTGIELMTNAGQALRFLPVTPSFEGLRPSAGGRPRCCWPAACQPARARHSSGSCQPPEPRRRHSPQAHLPRRTWETATHGNSPAALTSRKPERAAMSTWPSSSPTA